jgi:lipopolysaccharide/colanic/teichoic acid biosynthesis glycosyltransferase
MVLAPWIQDLKTRIRIWPNSGRAKTALIDEAQFRAALARERMRTDRNSSPLAVLIIDLPPSRTASSHIDFLLRVLEERLRTTDTLGVVAQASIGVLLPDTTKSGAWKVASDVCAVYPVGHDRPNCEVYVYPDDRAAWNGAGSETADHIDSLLISPMSPVKRLLDILGAVIGLTISAPLIVLIAAAIKLTSRGPALYAQEREGLGGRKFRIYKLRTMRMDAEQLQDTLRAYSEQDGPAFKMSRDPRTTWIGRWLRRTSLDELPQLWNVLRGEMSLVGPRPLPTAESAQCVSWQRRRLTVTPGITCIWQIWGRNTVPFDEWMRMDLRYVERRSLAFDLGLLVKTPPAMILKQGPR